MALGPRLVDAATFTSIRIVCGALALLVLRAAARARAEAQAAVPFAA